MKNVLTLLLLLCTAAFTAQISSTQLNDFAGGARQGCAVFKLQNTAYVGLGLTDDCSISCFANSWYRYNATADSWAPIAPYPGKGRMDAASFVLDGKAYVGAGHYFFPINDKPGYAQDFYADFYRYDPDTDSWEAAASLPSSYSLYWMESTCGFALAGKGIMINPRLRQVWRYLPDANSWERLSDFPGYQGNRMLPFEWNGRRYLAFRSFDESFKQHFEIWSVEENPDNSLHWEMVFRSLIIHHLDPHSSDGSAIVLGDEVYFLYGGKEHHTVFQYNLASKNLENIGDVLDLGEARSYSVAFEVSGNWYFGLGGIPYWKKGAEIWRLNAETIATDELSVEPLLRCQPTLVNTFCTLTFSEHIGQYTLRVFTASGALVTQLNGEGASTQTLPATDWPSGVYTFLLNCTAGSVAQRVVKW